LFQKQKTELLYKGWLQQLWGAKYFCFKTKKKSELSHKDRATLQWWLPNNFSALNIEKQKGVCSPTTGLLKWLFFIY